MNDNDMIWDELIIWIHMIWYDMIWYDMIWCMRAQQRPIKGFTYARFTGPIHKRTAKGVFAVICTFGNESRKIRERPVRVHYHRIEDRISRCEKMANSRWKVEKDSRKGILPNPHIIVMWYHGVPRHFFCYMIWYDMSLWYDMIWYDTIQWHLQAHTHTHVDTAIHQQLQAFASIAERLVGVESTSKSFYLVGTTAGPEGVWDTGYPSPSNGCWAWVPGVMTTGWIRSLGFIQRCLCCNDSVGLTNITSKPSKASDQRRAQEANQQSTSPKGAHIVSDLMEFS